MNDSLVEKTSDYAALEKRTVSKVFWRLMPFLGLLYIVAFLDRVNIGFAALSMNKELGFSNAIYGLGAGIFFIGYFFMEIPGNLIMARVGARLWMARILITWGLISGLTAFVTTPTHFYLVRFFLGMAEASFFPGIIYYLALWNRKQDLAKAVAMFFMALPVCNIIGAPLSTYLLGINWAGYAGWQWMFFIEAIPAIILGIITPFYLTNKPSDAKWLTNEERNWLVGVLSEESAKKTEQKKYTLMQAFADRDVILCSVFYFLVVVGLYGLGLFLPILVKALSTTISITAVGWLVAIPYVFAFFGIYLIGRNSDRTGERRWHAILCMIAGAGGLAGSVLFSNVSVFVSMVCFTISTVSIYACFGPFWAIPNSFLTSTAAAGAIAMINSIGNLGGFVGPYVMGLIRDMTGSFNGGMMFLAVCLLGAAVALMLLRKVGKEPKATVGA